MCSLFKLTFLLAITSLTFSYGQENLKYKIHSHNDYEQSIPLWNAYGNGVTSIEIDVFLKNDTLYVTHEPTEIKKKRTIENLYLIPLQKTIYLQLGNQQEVQLLIDIKSEAHATLKKLVETLQNFPDLIKAENISFVISGNRPEPELYINYPDYIQFDYQSLETISNTEILNKIALISLPFKYFSNWNGKGRLTKDDYKKVSTIIDKAHSFKKPFRFWGTPDSKTAWKTFTNLGVDFINTDVPADASKYLKTLKNRVYHNSFHSDVYKPTFASDRKNSPVKNIILLIGDGNGLSQISSAVLANNGELTLTQLKSIGFIKTQSADDFTTDSAAAGTAIATGEKTYNRAIGMNSNRKPIENITELLYKYQFNSGCITTDEITGATPASFYSHQLDRDMTNATALDLVNSKLSLFIGGGSDTFQNKFSKSNFSILNSIDKIQNSKKEKVGFFFSEKDVPSMMNGRGNILAEATKKGLAFLNKKNKPFFLMVEGAKIDSYGHQNNIAGIISEGIDFDTAITEAIKFADTTGNTLVIITADHETSGLSLPQGNVKEKIIEGDFTTYDHTGTMVPIFAYGPQSDKFSGIYENNKVFHKIKEVLNIK
ncbi:alkaline phosphatase [Tenacibaculum adriaticum]|uniref:Alkaline phosphatase n=1 Tax=Tenacibaculum adriaticum TaxID=413713 RepID=A0A5S5DXG3_9FLAO|nr:alkaline phosphatase [Tenacibaculum adriaticum]TYP99299.1 alkaline phosphatase [Tenacibaculum adriaticum]